MTRIHITIIADDGSELPVEVDDGWNTEQVVQALIQERFLSALHDENSSYLLTLADAVRERKIISEDQTLADAGIRPDDYLLISIVSRIIPNTTDSADTAHHQADDSPIDGASIDSPSID